MFNRPALLDLINRTRADIVSRLSNSDLLRRSNAEVYTRALAGVAHGLYGYIEWLSRQLIYDTAEGSWLERWASIWGITRKASTFATGSVTFTGSNGAPIPYGSVLAAYDGVLYATTADFEPGVFESGVFESGATTIASGSAVVGVVALVAGLSGNRLDGQTFTLQSPVSGVNSSAAAGAMTGGVNVETDDGLRSRLLTRIRKPPQGGCSYDYLAWALAVPGVTRAWVYSMELGPGTVTVRFVMDGSYIDGIPLSGDVAAVAAAIDSVRPVTAMVTVVAPVAVPLNFTITGLSPATAAVQAAVTQELTDLIAREAVPGGTLL